MTYESLFWKTPVQSEARTTLEYRVANYKRLLKRYNPGMSKYSHLGIAREKLIDFNMKPYWGNKVTGAKFQTTR